MNHTNAKSPSPHSPLAELVLPAIIVLLAIVLFITSAYPSAMAHRARGFVKNVILAQNKSQNVRGASDTTTAPPNFIHILPDILKAFEDDSLPDADTSSVGSGGGGTGGSGNLQAVVDWASQISANLSTACNDTWCRLATPVSNNAGFSTGIFSASDCGSNGGAAGNKYWCADLVWQSYHLAGFTDVIASPGVPTMHNWWRANPPGYYFIPYDGTSVLDTNTLSRIKPGCAIMYGSQSDPVSNRGEHIEIIHTISYDGNKNGSITTYAANSGNKTRTDPIAQGVVVSAHSYDVMGFGCHN